MFSRNQTVLISSTFSSLFSNILHYAYITSYTSCKIVAVLDGVVVMDWSVPLFPPEMYSSAASIISTCHRV